MKARVVSVAVLCLCHDVAQAGFGGMANVEEPSSGPIDTSVLTPILIGAAIGYYLERAIAKRRLDKQGIRYDSSVLGGKAGAIIGAIAFPIVVGLLK